MYYAVIKKDGAIIYESEATFLKQASKKKRAHPKTFGTKGEVLQYIEADHIHVKDWIRADMSYRTCVICGKPHKRRTELCMGCKKKKDKLFEKTGKKSVLSNKNLVGYREKYQCEDIFEFLSEHPEKIGWVGEKYRTLKRDIKFEARKDPEYKGNDAQPLYIKTLLGEDKEFLGIEGTKKNPLITFRCKKCNETIRVMYQTLLSHPGHNCASLLSSGEFLVKAFLDSIAVKYKTQKDTLICVNPKTGCQLPYDFEIPDKKVIIEVQGEQHKKFIPIFHMDMEGFEYQREKDALKKQYAIEQGYLYLEIWYEDFKDDLYKKKIAKALSGDGDYTRNTC